MHHNLVYHLAVLTALAAVRVRFAFAILVVGTHPQDDEFADSKYRPCPLPNELVAAGHLGRKSGRGVFSC
jgi:hypothetical protein